MNPLKSKVTKRLLIASVLKPLSFKSRTPAVTLPAGVLGVALLSCSSLSVANNSEQGFEQQKGVQSQSAIDYTASNRLSSPGGFASRFDTSELSLPDLGSGGARFIETNQHKALGEWSIQKLGGSAPLLNDPWSQEQLEDMTWRINAQARTQAPLALMVVNNPSINAFAIPGGVMGVHTGTIIESHSMDEVASVMAHEVAHLSQRHYEHRSDASAKALMLQIGGLLAAIAATAANGDAAAAIMMGSQTAALNSQMAFSRSNEREADRIGMQLMAKAGYNPKAMPRFFSTLNQKTQLNMSDNAYLPSFIMTHPLSSERLSEAQTRASRYVDVNISSQNDPVTFDLLKWRLKLLSKQTTEGELRASSARSRGASMALAYWYAQRGRYQEANSLLSHVQKLPKPESYTDRVSFDVLMAITQADIAAMQNKWQEAEQYLLPYYSLYPERRDIKLAQAQVWLYLGKHNEVIKSLKPLIQSRPHDIEALYFMQRAYELMAQDTTNNPSGSGQNQQVLSSIATANGLRYRAQGELWRAKYDDALVSLQQAKKVLEESSSIAGSQFNAKPLIASVKAEMAEARAAKDFRP